MEPGADDACLVDHGGGITTVFPANSAGPQYGSSAKGHSKQSGAPNPLELHSVPLHYPVDSDWETSKAFIEDLYLRRNLPVKVVALIMRQTHGFKASDRMYKTRFVKWGWKKSGEARAVQSTRLGRLHAQQIAIRLPYPQKIFKAQDTGLLLHESQNALQMDAALRGYRNYVLSWAANDPRWQSANKFQDIDATQPEFTIEDDMRMAAVYFANSDPVVGGRFLRLAFTEIEKMLTDNHLHTSWVLFLWAPLKICSMPSSVAEHVIRAYSRYIYQLSSILRHDHPILDIARSLLNAAKYGGISAVLSWTSTISRLLYDTYVHLRGLCAGAIQKLSLYAHTVQDRAMQEHVMVDTMNLASRAAEEFGENSIDALQPMCVALTHRAKLEIYDDIFLSTAVRVAMLSSRRYEETLKIGSESWYNRHNEHWTFRNSHFLLAKYWMSKGDSKNFVGYARTATVIDDRADDVWKMFASAVEKLYREENLIEEAEVLALQRKAYDMAPEAEELLAKEENTNTLTQSLLTQEKYDDSEEEE